MLIRKTKFVALFLLIFPYFVTPEENYVYDYDSDNFKQKIEEMDGNFIMFYAPWCRHCTAFHPIWLELAELVNTQGSKFAIAQVDCTVHSKLCQENDITGYPTLLYFHKNSFVPVEYKGTRDLPSLTLFLNDVFTLSTEGHDKESSEVKVYSGVAYLTDANIEKHLAFGQHFVMFYAPWCKASQKLAPIWAELAVQYAHNKYIHIGKVNCMENEWTCKNFDVKQYPYLVWIYHGRIVGISSGETLQELKQYVDTMLLTETYDPEKFLKKKKTLPVARILEETFDIFMETDLVFINYFAPWCAHCMQLSPLWIKLGEKFQNNTRVLIADVDCVKSKEVCEAEKITSFPTLVLYKDKKMVFIENGGRPLETLIALVNEHLEDQAPAKEISREEKTKDEL
ncbi:thioredoxin domain-containing protein 5 [Hyposmocoma kahamanoa]|uniref:thioredoxin domain-containing protein 5 n=1 Tax=Hyposmocoma kahamanoa TaxID=1477025 RepID=UPI000E6D8028|nr:thioredoxin domain-containing protein 5 [Hyposmocoma kahamanoa]